MKDIDIARGIAMISIILGHLGNGEINRVVFTYHVPLFFLVSGYFFNPGKGTRQFVVRRVRTLLVPYLVSCALIMVSAVVVNLITRQGKGTGNLVLHWLYAAAYGAGDSYTTPFVIHKIGAIWFLLALFWANLIFLGLIRTRPVIRLAAVLGFFFLAQVSTKLFWFPASIQAAGPALLYLYIGYLLKENREAIRRIPRAVIMALALIALGMWIWFIVGFQGYWLVHCHMGRGVIDFIGSLCGCWWILILSKYVFARVPVLSGALAWLGRYSLLVLCAHIIELNTFPWGTLMERMAPQAGEAAKLWLTVLGKMMWAGIVAGILARGKVSKRLFGYGN